MYGPGRLSQPKTAEIAGATRHELLEALTRVRISPFQTSPELLARETGRGSLPSLMRAD
jgi:hypothetical protein